MPLIAAVRHQGAILLDGAKAAELAALLAPKGLDAKPVSGRLGIASAIKMCSSVMINSLKELVIESCSTARACVVEDHLLPT